MGLMGDESVRSGFPQADISLHFWVHPWGYEQREGAFESSSSAVQAVVAMGAQTDLLSVRVKGISGDEDRGLIAEVLGGSQTEQMAQYRLASLCLILTRMIQRFG